MYIKNINYQTVLMHVIMHVTCVHSYSDYLSRIDNLFGYSVFYNDDRLRPHLNNINKFI
jgi:hypothetical protein